MVRSKVQSTKRARRTMNLILGIGLGFLISFFQGSRDDELLKPQRITKDLKKMYQEMLIGVERAGCSTLTITIDGGLSEWSEWSKCDKLCTAGKHARHRTCINPPPTCGGKPCNSSLKTTQEQPCNFCPESPLRSYDGYCVQPKSASCNPIENTTTWSHALILKKADAECSKEYMEFIFDTDGIIYHKCSGKIVCPEGNYPSENKKLVLKDSCERESAMYTRLPSMSLQNKQTNLCLDTSGVSSRNGTFLRMSRQCNKMTQAMEFFKLTRLEG